MASLRQIASFLIIAASAVAFAACPSGVPSGVTACYYISAAGADTNAGTSEAAPWLHAPGMPNCTNTCATVTPAAGDGFIFRGGDTWHFGNSAATPYTGGSFDLWTGNTGGTSANPIYFGMDTTWFSGASFARPIMTGDNPTSTTAVASCTYQTGAKNNIFMVWNYTEVDNLEFTGLCQQDTNNTLYDAYLFYAGTTGDVFNNLYVHGWTHLAFSCTSPTTGLCTNIEVFLGGLLNTNPGETISNSVVDGSDSDGGGANLCLCTGYDIHQNVFRYVGNLVVTTAHTLHDNLLEHWYEPGDQQNHGNLYEEDSESTTSGPNVAYNNLFRDVCTDTNACPLGIVGFWPLVPVGVSDYWFNNVVYSTTNLEYFDVGQHSGSSGSLYVFNNTFEQSQTANAVFNCYTGPAPFSTVNNHYIYDGTNLYGSSCATLGTAPYQLTELTMTHATATTDGYTSSQTLAYSPTSGSSPTVATGTNEYTGLCGSLTGAAQTACRESTGYACTYNSTAHTVSCPATTANSRPSSGAWDTGAYQFSGVPPWTHPPMSRKAAILLGEVKRGTDSQGAQ